MYGHVYECEKKNIKNIVLILFVILFFIFFSFYSFVETMMMMMMIAMTQISIIGQDIQIKISARLLILPMFCSFREKRFYI